MARNGNLDSAELSKVQNLLRSNSIEPYAMRQLEANLHQIEFASQFGSRTCTFACRPRMRFAKRIQKIEKELMDGAMASGAMKQPKSMHGESRNGISHHC